MKNIFKHIFLLSLLTPTVVQSQGQPFIDLPPEQFYNMVYQMHPVARQASLLTLQGSLTVQEAKGSFDPKITSNYSRKEFEGKNYYDIWDTYVQVPTLLNIDLKAGYERNQGLFLDPERTVPENGLYYTGVSVPLGQGLVNNQRNIALKKSRFLEKDFQNEASTVLNNLLLDANHAYWWWYENYQKSQLARNNLELITERFQGIREAALRGENAAIDTVEMLIQVQQWTNNLETAELNLRNSLLLLQNFIWSDSIELNFLTPTYGLKQNESDLDSYLDWAIVNHPDLRKLSIKSSILELDRKMSSEQLKPVVNLNYNLLSSSQNQDSEPSFYTNDYKLGVRFAFPLLIRKERAKLKIVELKQQENDLETSRKYREIINKIRQSYNEVFTLKEMIDQQEQILENYERMLLAEEIRFDNGESSVFLLNSRENKKLAGEIKLIELKSKYRRSIGKLKWSTGILQEEIKAQNSL